MTVTDTMRHRYLNDAQFHAQVYEHANRTCRPNPGPCALCLDAAIIAVSKIPFLGHADAPACTHGSATGVDLTDPGDSAKVWCCDACGFTFREIIAGYTIVGRTAVVPCGTCGGSGEVTEADGDERGGSHQEQCAACSSTGWVAG